MDGRSCHALQIRRGTGAPAANIGTAVRRAPRSEFIEEHARTNGLAKVRPLLATMTSAMHAPPPDKQPPATQAAAPAAHRGCTPALHRATPGAPDAARTYAEQRLLVLARLSQLRAMEVDLAVTALAQRIDDAEAKGAAPCTGESHASMIAAARQAAESAFKRHRRVLDALARASRALRQNRHMSSPGNVACNAP